ncbi:ANTAR domain-containing response regulator [Aeromonas sp. BIGb0445]|uniref:ANTAR domain-containing response regulator n=1 Tax=Aeromonas sp. BIGb0445 TaxID=2940593 RepID=UPI002167FE07|nr:ANTAR domain-containing protein [Aeromonas sp. BIGb0445]MCS3461834.1 response regulator NasT [Aeromonas sp. BIGb0445]
MQHQGGSSEGRHSILLIHADDRIQANRLGILVSHYGHSPRILDERGLLGGKIQGDGLLISCRRFSAEIRLAMTQGQLLPRILFCDRLTAQQQAELLAQGALVVPHGCGEREPVEQWLRLARAQLAMVQQQQQAQDALKVKLEERRLIEQAKGRLMRHQGLDEEAAYQAMRSTAMAQNHSLAELARRLLQALPA